MAHRTAPAIGIRLKSLREAKGIPLRQIANVTKIGTHALEALEHGDFSKLPGGIYTRSAIRSYAAVIGLDPDETLSEFMSECPGRIEPVSKLEAGPGERRAAGVSWVRRLREEMPSLKTAASVLALALAAGYAAVSWTARGEPVLPSSPLDVLAAQALIAAPVEPAVTRVAYLLNGQRGDEAIVPAIPSSALTIELLPDASCWISLGIDGGEADSRLLEAGERIVIEAQHEIVLKVGDAGAVALWINGLPAQRLGGSGQVATVHISAENFPQFLGS